MSKSIFMVFEKRGGITNGDVIKKLFPYYDIEIDEHKGYVRIMYDDFYTTYSLEWWNLPYNGGKA